ncbi:MAG: hypothetical protein IT292_10025 [Deltaproteobacteria bacterium]|nr:hypothetical protein [Deltaproteobacteria bacterium]
MLKQRKLYFLIAVLFGLFLFSALIVRQSGLSLYQSLKDSASAQDTQFSGSTPTFSLPLVFKIENLIVSLPTKPIRLPIELKNNKLRLSLLNLLLARVRASSNSDFYEGKVIGEITGPSFSAPDNFMLKGSNILLEQYPLLQMLRLSGKLGFELEVNQVLVKKIKQNNFRLEAEINEGSYQGNYKIQGLFPIPSIKTYNLKLSASGKGRFSTLKLLDFRSDLGDVKVKGTANFSEDYHKLNGSISGKITLTPKGQKELGDYLRMAAKSSPSESGDGYDFNIMFDEKKITDFTVTPE